MSKKINLSGKCLALTNYWFFNFQLFNRNFYLFKKYFLILFLLNKLLAKKSINSIFFLTNYITYFISKKKIFIVVSLLNSNLSSHFISLLKLLKNKYEIPLLIKIFINKNFYFSNFFLKDLIFYLILNKKLTPKKIFNYISNFFKKKINFFLIKNSKYGIQKKKLIGLKIQLKGRYEVTKNSMSKKSLLKLGKLNSTTLNNYSIFYKHNFFSKLGLSSLKIWVSYKLIS